jgi:hypothetical protein
MTGVIENQKIARACSGNKFLKPSLQISLPGFRITQIYNVIRRNSARPEQRDYLNIAPILRIPGCSRGIFELKNSHCENPRFGGVEGDQLPGCSLSERAAISSKNYYEKK